jgi:hypothetical protein
LGPVAGTSTSWPINNFWSPFPNLSKKLRCLLLTEFLSDFLDPLGNPAGDTEPKENLGPRGLLLRKFF